MSDFFDKLTNFLNNLEDKKFPVENPSTYYEHFTGARFKEDFFKDINIISTEHQNRSISYSDRNHENVNLYSLEHFKITCRLTEKKELRGFYLIISKDNLTCDIKMEKNIDLKKIKRRVNYFLNNSNKLKGIGDVVKIVFKKKWSDDQVISLNEIYKIRNDIDQLDSSVPSKADKDDVLEILNMYKMAIDNALQKNFNEAVQSSRGSSYLYVGVSGIPSCAAGPFRVSTNGNAIKISIAGIPIFLESNLDLYNYYEHEGLNLFINGIKKTGKLDNILISINKKLLGSI